MRIRSLGPGQGRGGGNAGTTTLAGRSGTGDQETPAGAWRYRPGDCSAEALFARIFAVTVRTVSSSSGLTPDSSRASN